MSPTLKVGLFTRTNLEEASKKRQRTQQRDVDLRVARELSPAMANFLVKDQVQPYIQDGASFLVIGDQADATEQPMTGKIHQICYELDCHGIAYALDTVIRAPSSAKTKSKILAAAMEQNIKDTIRKIKPRVILALCVEAAQIILPGLDGSVVDLRGQAFPAHIGDHDFWLIVTHDPRKIELDQFNRPPIWVDAILHDTRLAVRKWKENSKPYTFYSRMPKERLRSAITIGTDNRIELLRDFARDAGEAICLDYETRPLLPWKSEHPKITAIGLSDGVRSISIPLDHKLFIDPEEREELVTLFKACLSGRVVVAHNVLFELYWTFWLFGKDAVFSAKRWECTQAGAFVSFVRAAARARTTEEEDPGAAGTSLNDQCLLHFGLDVKGLSPELSWDEDKVSLKDHLIYNGLDAHFGFLLWKVQQEVLLERDLYHVYRFRLQRSVWLAWSSVRGMPLDHDCVKEFWDEICEAERAAYDALYSHPDIKAYEKRFGQFEASDDDVGQLLTKICGVKLGTTETGRAATNKAAILALAEDHPVGKLVIAFREVKKQKSTYLDKLRWEADKTYVGVDGKIHPQRSPTIAVTGRHSSKEPNAQNQPARGKWKKIRRVVRARKGWGIVSVDMGQIEARVIAMASGDKRFTASLCSGGLDVHMDWAKRIEEYDRTWQESYDTEIIILRDRHRMDLKGLRGKTKNGFVFPAFFGAGAKKISEQMLLNQDLTTQILKDFWVEFSGVKEWHKRVTDFYKKHFYVQSLTGFRIYGPLSYNNIINYGIQCTASEILQNAAGIISRLAYRLNRPWMVPIIDIHDDLTFHIPTVMLEEFLQTIIPIMLRPKFDFITVPLTCEVKVGEDWEHMQEIGTFSSEQDEIRIELNHAH